MHKWLTNLLLIGGLFSPYLWANETPTVEPQVISMSRAESLLGTPNVYFLDANTPEIWQQGHLPGAIYINQAKWETLLPADKEATLVFYCANRLCYASHEAAGMAIEMGYRQVFVMPEGIFGWIGSGRQIEKEDSA